jgi:hypothetical protein
METLNRRVQALMNAFKNYPVPQGGLSDRSTVHDLPCFPYDSSSIPQLADMDVLCNLPVSGGGSNLDSNTRSISNYFPQQHTNNCMFKLDFDFFPTFNPYLCNIGFVFAAILLTLCFLLYFCSGDGSEKIQ